jgi:phosphatidylglycerophosphate synthase
VLARRRTAVSLHDMTDRATDRRLFDLPNMLSMSRVVLAIVFPFSRRPLMQALLIALAASSDFLDGWIARSRQAASKWGALLDPITDRVFVIVALATYVFIGALTTGEYFTMIIRDLATAIGFLVARAVPSLQRVTFRARMSGKITTAVQLLVLIAVPLAPTLVRPLVIAVGLLSVWAILDYTLALQRARAAA